MYKLYYLNFKTPSCLMDFVFENLLWNILFCKLLGKIKKQVASPEQRSTPLIILLWFPSSC